MKHLKLFESFDKKSYYEFDAIKFYNDFKKIFNEEKEIHPDFSGNFFKFLGNFLWDEQRIGENWKNNIPLDDTVNGIIKEDILKNKFVSFYDLAEDVNSGKVRNVKFYYSLFFKDFSYSIDLGGLSKYGYPEEKENYITVKYIIPIRIYNSEPTKIEKFVDLYMARNKFNI